MAEAAESTRRNLRLLVRMFGWVPLIIGGIVLMAFAIGEVPSHVSVKSEVDAYGQVEQTRREVGYNPPSYTCVVPRCVVPRCLVPEW